MLKYLNADRTLIYTANADETVVVIVEKGDPRFAELEAQGPLNYEPSLPDIEGYRRAIDAHVEATARSRQYNSAAHMASYIASTVPEWAAEAQAFVAWRDQVWVTAIGLLATTTEAPKIEAVIEALPQIEWPAR